MAKIWCEECRGSGKKTEVMYLGEGVRGIGQSRTYDCPICCGKGYTESEPPKAERINPSAREMIEAEIARWDIEGYEAHYMRKGLRYALECLDKPAYEVSEEDHKKIHERYTQSIAPDAKYYTAEEFKALTGLKF